MQSPKLREWLNFPKSRTLLLNGDGDGDEMFSPTTFLSAKLLESLSYIEPVVLQHFFCSLHTSSSNKDNMTDATGLIKSFVSQLLLRDDVSWDLTFLSTTEVENVQNGDVEKICALFRSLIEQLPDGTFLFWMIDSINYYERSERRRGFLKVIHSLLDTIEGCKNGVVIKFLLTCPSKSLFVKDLLRKEDIVTVPPTVDGSRQGWSERAFQNTIGNDVERFR